MYHLHRHIRISLSRIRANKTVYTAAVTDTVGVAPFAVSFFSTSQHTVEYLWNFGDGQTSTTLSPTHTYQSMGIKSWKNSVERCQNESVVARKDYAGGTNTQRYDRAAFGV